MQIDEAGRRTAIDVAFSHWRANDVDARFLGGERNSDFYARIEQSIVNLLSDDPSKSDRHGGDMESLAHWMLQARRARST